MRAWAMLAVAITLAGCPKTTAPVAVGPPQGHPDLACPPGTVPAGFGPPNGIEAFCQKQRPDAVWVRQGPAIEWHTNEQRASEGSYVDGKRDGPWLFWYPTGSAEKQGTYSRGVEEGVWTEYHVNGDRKSEGQWVDGKQHGHWTFWNSDSLTRTEGNFVLGEKDGTWIDVGTDEQPIRERLYRQGRLISQREL